MRKVASAAMFACAVITMGSSQGVSAETQSMSVNSMKRSVEVAMLVTESAESKENERNQAVAVQQKVVKHHTVQENENLSIIAAQHGTVWTRIYDKNIDLENPDIVNAGQVLIIPETEEQLTSRPLPQPPVVVEVAPTSAPAAATATPSSQNAPQPVSRGSVAGNTYTAGYCTWYVKNMRPDLPNNLGNADTWTARAAAQGLPTGSTPRVGAVGQQGMHVVYVQSVNGDGTVTISEMNFRGLYVVSSRTVPASSFSYIY